MGGRALHFCGDSPKASPIGDKLAGLAGGT